MYASKPTGLVTPTMNTVYVPVIDEAVPLPNSAAEALPELSPYEELEMRARTIKLISDLSGQPLIPDTSERNEAESIAKQMMEDPKLRPDFAKYSDPTMAYLAGMIQKSNMQLVDELSELKNYVINKLIMEVENADNSKTRIAALRSLGEVDGVDAFKKRSELTVKHKPIEEVEQELKSILEGIEFKVLGGENGRSSQPDIQDSPEV
jgi:hypothetical protein